MGTSNTPSLKEKRDKRTYLSEIAQTKWTDPAGYSAGTQREVKAKNLLGQWLTSCHGCHPGGWVFRWHTPWHWCQSDLKKSNPGLQVLMLSQHAACNNYAINNNDIYNTYITSSQESTLNRPLSLKSSHICNGLAYAIARSRGERVSWVAGWAHSCISLVLVVVKTSHFSATRGAKKITTV